ncbi:MAG: hypothetical protein JXR73_01625 [Candidatus Omnitrophica bacterium]|nr:hypothetical protein [Candidatus Omnitrophota bacterium]
MQSTHVDWKKIVTHPIALLAFLLLTVFLVYLPALSVPPYLDDNSAILNNTRVTDIKNISLIFRDFFVGRGLVQLSLALEWHYFDDEIRAMHGFNILYHLLAAMLVYFCVRAVRRFLYPGSQNEWRRYAGLGAALVFALHPVNTQPVTYIISRANILATIFFLAGIFFPLKIYFLYRARERTFWARCLWFASMLAVFAVCFLLGLGSKEIIVTLPLVWLMLLACAWRRERILTILKRLSLFCLPFAILFIAYFIYRKVTLGAYLSFPDIEARSPWVNFGTQICIMVLYYIPRTLIPVNLLFRPPFPLVNSIGDPRLLLSVLVLILIGMIALYLFRKKTEISLGIFWFFVTLAPTSTLIPLWDLIAERRLYLSMIGAALIAESLFFYLWKQSRRPIRLAAVNYSAAVVILFSVLTLMRNVEYQNPTRFWHKEHLYSPYNLENLHNYLYRLSQNNHGDEAKKVLQNLNWDKIKEQNEFIDTGSLDSLIRLMLNYRIEVEYASMLAEKNAEKYPSPFTLNTYQLALMVQHRFKDAMEIIDKTLAMDRNHVDTLFNKAFIFRIFGLYSSAEECLAMAMRLRPDDIVLLEEQVELYRAMKKDTGPIETKIEALKGKNKYASEIDLKSSL